MGVLGDVVAGYNLLSGDVLYGVEADVGYSSTHFSEPCWGQTCEGRFGFMGSLRARVGLRGGRLSDLRDPAAWQPLTSTAPASLAVSQFG